MSITAASGHPSPYRRAWVCSRESQIPLTCALYRLVGAPYVAPFRVVARSLTTSRSLRRAALSLGAPLLIGSQRVLWSHYPAASSRASRAVLR